MTSWYELVEQELTALVLRHAEEVTEMWAIGEFPAGNLTIDHLTADFTGVQYAPWFEGGAFHAESREEWINGTAEAARNYKGHGFRWTIDHVTVLPRSPEEGIVTYRVSHWPAGGKPPARALFLETWVKNDGQWYLRRHTAEKASPVTAL